jgi:hypothetical protein
MLQLRTFYVVAVAGSLVACSSSKETTPPPAGTAADAGSDATTTPVPDGSTPTPVESGTADASKDPNPPATACTAPPFINFSTTLTLLDVSGSMEPLAGATVGFSSCPGFDVTTNTGGTAMAQLTQDISVSPIYGDGITALGSIGAEIPTTADVLQAVTIFASDVAPAIPGFQLDGGDAATIAILLQADPAATAPCNAVAGATLSVTGHPEAVVSYANPGWPANPAATTAPSTGPYVFINGITGASKVAVTGTMAGCAVNLATATQTGNFAVTTGALTIGLATITN